MKKFFFTNLILLAFCFSINAQFGIRVGANIANQPISAEGISISPSSITAFHVGVFYEAALSDAISIRPALLYSLKGSEIEFLGESAKSTFNYLELPIDFVYKLNAGNLAVPIHAGPYLGYLMSVKSGDETLSGDDLEGTNQLDFGLNLGAGIELMDNALLIGLNYGLGLANIVEEDPDFDATIKNAVFSIFAGYKF